MTFLWLFIALLVLMVAGGLFLAWQMIGGEAGRHEGAEDFDWRERPRYDRGPDKLDRMIAKFALPVPVLADLLATDRFIASVDARMLSGAQ